MDNNRPDNEQQRRRRSNDDNLFGTALTAAAIGGIGFFVAKHFLGGKSEEKSYFSGPYGRREVDIISNENNLKEAMRKLQSGCDGYNVLGFDCEWNANDRVALLQLATKDYCALIRLCNFSSIPGDLRQLLNNRKIIKVGVKPLDDARRLLNEWDLKVVSTLDLRFMARISNLDGKSLKKMSQDYLKITIGEYNSNWDWHSDLTDEQINYAANDAQAGIKLFEKFEQIITKNDWWPNFENVRCTVEDSFDCNF